MANSAGSATSLRVTGLRIVVVLERARPNMPELGLLLVPVAAVVVVDGMLLPAPVVPERVRVAVAAAVVEGPGFGSLLGDKVRVLIDVDAEAESAPPLLTAPPLLRVRPFVGSSFLCALPMPAPGCRRERERVRAAAEDEDDMVVEGGGNVSSTRRQLYLHPMMERRDVVHAYCLVQGLRETSNHNAGSG